MSVDRLDFDEIMRIQNLMSSRIAQESEVDIKLKLIEIIQSLLGQNKRFIQIEEVIVEAAYEHIDETTVINVLDELNKDKMISMTEGRIRMNY